MIITQQVIAPDAKYQIEVPPGLVTYDIHNDSPYNMAVNFDADSGLGSAEYYMSPHSILYGLSSANSAPGYSVGGSRGAGQIFVYTQTPIGGTFNSSNAPAYSLTIAGYPAGRAPQSTVSLNRLSNIGNPVQTTMGGSTNVQNDNNAANTTFIEATVTGSPQSNVAIDNSGNLAIRQYIAGTLTTLFKIIAGASTGTSNVTLGDANHQVEILGNLKVDGSTFMGTTQLFGPLQLQAGSTIQLLTGSLTRIQGFSGGPGNGTITHNWGVAPDLVIPFYSNWTPPTPPSPPTQPLVTGTVTSTTAAIISDASYHWQALLVKF